MSQPTATIVATAKSVLDLLDEVERQWPIHENTKSPHSTYHSWHSKAHKAVSEGLMILSCSTWTYDDRAEEAKEREFPADEFNELSHQLQSLVPIPPYLVKMVSASSLKSEIDSADLKD